MKILRYEWHRLRVTRATWWISGLGLLLHAGAAAVAALLTADRMRAGAPAGTEAARHAVAAWAPALPLPLIAAAAGLLGASALRQERQHGQLDPVLAPVSRRLRLLAAKLVLLAAWATGLAAVGLLAGSVSASAVLGRSLTADPAGLGSDGFRLCAGVAAAAVAAAWLGLLGAGLLGSAAGGVLLVLAVPVAAEPLLGAVLGRRVTAADGSAADYLPFTLGEHWTFGGSAAGPLAALPGGVAVAAPLVPALLLLAGYGFALSRRRTL